MTVMPQPGSKPPRGLRASSSHSHGRLKDPAGPQWHGSSEKESALYAAQRRRPAKHRRQGMSLTCSPDSENDWGVGLSVCQQTSEMRRQSATTEKPQKDRNTLD